MYMKVMTEADAWELANRMAGISKRDEASVMQLNNLNMMEHIILCTIRDGMGKGLHYKQIYQECKKRLELVSELAYLGLRSGDPEPTEAGLGVVRLKQAINKKGREKKAVKTMKVRNEFYDAMTLDDAYACHERWGVDIILGSGDVDADAMEKELERKRALAAGTA